MDADNTAAPEPDGSLPARLRLAAVVTCAVAAAVPALLQLWTLVTVFSNRCLYPADLEWMEGAQLVHAHRLLQGEPLYTSCQSDMFIPFPYPPLHSVVLAGLGKIFGLGFGVGRSLSIGSLVVCSAVLMREISGAAARAGERPRGLRWLTLPFLGLLAMAAIAAGFPVVDSWYDLIRVDTMFLSLVLTAAALAADPESPALRDPGAAAKGGDCPSRPPFRLARLLATAALLTAAFFTKQTAAFFLPWIILYVFWRDRRRGLWLGAVTALSCGGILLLLQWATDGLYWTYTVTVLSRHFWIWEQAKQNALRVMTFAPYLPLIFVLAGWLWRKHGLLPRTVLWLGMLLCATAASMITSSKVGGHVNNLMPVIMLAGPVALMTVGQALRRVPWLPICRTISSMALLVLAFTLLWGQRYEPGRHIPSRQHWADAHRLNRFVADLSGGVIAPAHPFLAVGNGHQNPQLHSQGYLDIMGANPEGIDLHDCVAQNRAQWLIANRHMDRNVQTLLYRGYRYHQRLPVKVGMLAGMRTTPAALHRRLDVVLEGLERSNRRRLFDFEQGSFAGWVESGEAFRLGPSSGSTVKQLHVHGYRGRRLANSFHPASGDRAQGVLISPEFTIDRDYLGVLVGGGSSFRCRVELRVGDRMVGYFRGFNTEILAPAVWDVRKHRSRRAQIVIRDDSQRGWGHIMVDDIELFDSAGDGSTLERSPSSR